MDFSSYAISNKIHKINPLIHDYYNTDNINIPKYYHLL